MQYNSIFSQLFQFIPRHRFEKSVESAGADRHCRHFSAWRQFLTCLYAQITGKDSLREISDGLLTNRARLCHLGMEPVAKSTLADAMNRRAPAVFKALFDELLAKVHEAGPGARLPLPQSPLCLRQHDHPALPFRVRLGALPDEQGGSQAPHAA
jgi:putative transposase